MPSAPQRALLDIARAIEAAVEAEESVVGLDRSGHAMTIGRGATVRGVRVERSPTEGISARVEVVGRPGTALPEAGERLTAAVGEELDRFGLEGSVLVVFTDVQDAGAEDEGP